MTRAAIYARISRDEQSDYSIPTQQAANRAHCDERDYQIVAAFAEDFTGAKINRPELDRLIDLVIGRKVDVVVSYVLDRLTRGGAPHVGYFQTLFAENGARLELAAEDLDDSEEGHVMADFKGYAARKQWLATREATGRGIKAKVADGKPIGAAKAPFGLRWKLTEHDEIGRHVRGTHRVAYEADPETVPILKEMFARCDAGISLRQIGFWLEGAAVKPPRWGFGGSASMTWNPSTIRHILTNCAYVGEGVAFHRRKQDDGGPVPLAPDVFPKLIDPDLFARVQRRLANNRAANAQRKDRDPEIGLLRRGFARCGNPACNGSLMVNAKAKGGAMYCCHPKSRRAHRCPWVSIRCDELDGQVWARIETIRSDPSRARVLADRLRAGRDGTDRATAMLAALDARLADLDERIANLTDNLSRVRGAGADAVAEKINRHDEERDGLLAERGRFVDQAATEVERRARVERAVAIIDGTLPIRADLTYHEKRRILSDLGVVVRLFPRGSRHHWTMTLTFDNETDFGPFRADLHVSDRTPVEPAGTDGGGANHDPFALMEGDRAWNLYSSSRAIGASAAR